MEGRLHKSLKYSVAKELASQNYIIYYEPLESPFSHLWWHSYRPDILATLSDGFNQQIVLVECETKPNRKRVLKKTAKIKKNLSLQNRLHENTSILPLLIIPPKYLYRTMCSTIQGFWEIWIVNQLGKIKYRISRNKWQKIFGKHGLL